MKTRSHINLKHILKRDKNFAAEALPMRLQIFSPLKYSEIIPELLVYTMGSFRNKNFTLHAQCNDVLKDIENKFTQRIENTFDEVINSTSSISNDAKISAVQIMLHEVEQIKQLIQKQMRLIIIGDKYLQYPIPSSITFLFYFLEKEKILVELLDYFLEESKIRFREQVLHIRNQVQNLYQINLAKIYPNESVTPIPEVNVMKLRSKINF